MLTLWSQRFDGEQQDHGGLCSWFPETHQHSGPTPPPPPPLSSPQSRSDTEVVLNRAENT